MIAFKYFDAFFSAETDELVLAFSITVSVFLQIYYHLNNASLLWKKLYHYHFFISLISGSTSISNNFLQYIIMAVFRYRILFIFIAQFLMINISLYAMALKFGRYVGGLCLYVWLVLFSLVLFSLASMIA